jgi:autotransporter-associated beta strand protein
LTMGNGSVLDMNASSEKMGSLASASGYGRVTSSVSGTYTLTTGNDNGPTTYTGMLEDGVLGALLNLTKIGSGRFTLSTSANTYDGLTSVSAGILEIQSWQCCNEWSYVVCE